MPLLPMLLFWLLSAAVAGALVYGGIAVARPWLQRRAVAAVTARSSHRTPTPQGAGLIITPVALVVAGVSLAASGLPLPGGMPYAAAVALAAIMLMIVGFIDDVRPLGVAARLWAQVAAVGIAVLLAPPDIRIAPEWMPLAIERAAVILAGLWFVNLFNFMDGIDWISAAETLAIGLGIAILAATGAVAPPYGWVSAALIGAMLGFVPWNAPPARIFLGDAGSLPVGFLLGVLLFHVAASGAVAAALILPLYYLADATVTLLRRTMRGEPVWQPHRQHYYQQATQNGLTVREVIARIGIVDVLLIVLAVSSVTLGLKGALLALIVAAAAVAFLLRLLAKDRP